MKINLNHEVIIYPNERGFYKIHDLIQMKYQLTDMEAWDWVNKRRSNCGGYKEQLWVIVADFNEMFYNGQNYMEHAYMNAEEETK